MAYTWEPTTSEVAAYVPWLTVSAVAPGDQAYLNDFTAETVPATAQAQRHIDDATALIGGALGPLPSTQPALLELVRITAALLAAHTLALSYARSDDDRDRAAALLTRYQAARTALDAGADNAGADTLSPLPVLIAPAPVPHGDWLL